MKGNKISMNDSFEKVVVEQANLPMSVYKHAPKFLLSLCDHYNDKRHKDIVLLSSLVAISSILPNYYVTYTGYRLEANLYGYFYGNFGSDKSLISVAEKLIMPVHEEKRARTQKAFEEYQASIAATKSGKKKSKKPVTEDDELVNDTIEKISAPKDELLIIPANNTKANLYRQLNENSGRGIIVETEADTLSSALKQDHGNFSELLRKSYQHERFSVGRKSEFLIEIERPCLSILISSTPRQIVRLIPTVEDGLFSRFFFWKLSIDANFYDVFSDRFTLAFDKAKSNGVTLKKAYDILSNMQSNPCEFIINLTLRECFNEFFSAVKQEYHEVFNGDLNGLVHRFGIMFIRICMLARILRHLDENNYDAIPRYIFCTGRDFIFAREIIKPLLENSITVYELIMRNKPSLDSSIEQTKIQRDEQIKEAMELKKQGYNYREIAKAVLGTETSCGTISKWLKDK